MYWLPRDWVPWYVEWILAFPRAPTGSVSIQIWGIACASVVQLASAAVVATWALVLEKPASAGREKQPMKMGGGQGSGQEKEIKEL